LLEPDHIVGRATAPKCALVIDEPYVSAVHAVLRWSGDAWELKDLGSRNGTFLDGQRLEPAAVLNLERGARIGFGMVESEWELFDAAPPDTMAVPLDGSAPACLDGELIALPSSDDPSATIYRGKAGDWVLERAEESLLKLANAQTFEAAGRLWRFCCCEVLPATLATPGAADLDIRGVSLSFNVSRDEEYVHLRMTRGNQQFDLGQRAHNYLLLTLARCRLADAEQGLPDTSCGWMDQEELARDPSMAPPQLNIDVFRIRQQFAKTGILDPATIIERRHGPRQLRIGTGKLTINTL